MQTMGITANRLAKDAELPHRRVSEIFGERRVQLQRPTSIFVPDSGLRQDVRFDTLSVDRENGGERRTQKAKVISRTGQQPPTGQVLFFP